MPAPAQQFESPPVHPIDLTPDRATLLVTHTADHRLAVYDVTGSVPTLVREVSVGLDPVTVRARTSGAQKSQRSRRPVPLGGIRYSDPGLEPLLERVYPTPWTRCDREADYRQAWTEFERRFAAEKETN